MCLSCVKAGGWAIATGSSTGHGSAIRSNAQRGCHREGQGRSDERRHEP